MTDRATPRGVPRWGWWFAVAVVAALVPFGLSWAGWRTAVSLPVYVLLAVGVAAAVRRAGQGGGLTAAERGAERRALVPAVIGGVAYATGCLLVTAGAILLVLVPDPAVAASVWRTLGDGGTGLPVIVLTLAAAWALRRVSPRAAAAWWTLRGLPPAVDEQVAGIGREVARIRRWRTLPAVLGAAVLVAPGAAYGRAVAQGVTGDALEAIDALAPVRSLGLAYPLIGYLLGVLVAEVTRRRPRSDVGVARLDARRPVGYLSSLARWLPLVVGAGLLLLAAVRAVVADVVGPPPVGPYPSGPDLGVVVVAAAVVLLGVPAAQRWVIGRPQRLEDPVALEVDDTFRSSAAHAVVGGGAALALAVASGVLDDIWNAVAVHGGLGWFGLPLGIVGLTVVAAAYGVWFGLGSSHPGRRPDVTAVPSTGGAP